MLSCSMIYETLLMCKTSCGSIWYKFVVPALACGRGFLKNEFTSVYVHNANLMTVGNRDTFGRYNNSQGVVV